MATEGALRNGSGGLTEIELISIALEKLHMKAAKHLPILAAKRAACQSQRRKKRGRYSRKSGMQNQMGISLTDRNRAKVAVASLLRRHSPFEAKKQHPNRLSGRLGLVYVKRLLSSSSGPRTTG